MTSYAGSFLVARPSLQDPNFRQTVVLLIQHGKEGAFGVVVNRPVEATELPFPVFAGGPCESPGLLLLHGEAEWAGEDPDAEKNEVAPGIYLGDAASVEHLQEHGGDETPRLRLFTGYAGWGEDQLEGELTEGAWALVPADGKLLFETPAEDLWQRLVPPTIPQPSVN